MKTKIIVFIAVLLVIAVVVFQYQKNNKAKFEAPRQDTPLIGYTIKKNTSLDAVISDLKYFDFIKDEDSFRYALEHSEDNTPGNDNALRIGNNTIDREALYKISQSMSTWEIASILLNEGERSTCDHGCPDSNFTPELLPGGDLAPTLEQKYSWVETYEDCVEAVGAGHDGGQLSSEQYYEHSGVRTCYSPDGRLFVEGQEGWTTEPQP